MTSTYRMDKTKHAICFDWGFANAPVQGRISGIVREHKHLVSFLKGIGFKIYDENGVKGTRSLDKAMFLAKLNEFRKECRKECSCIFVSLSTHGFLRKTTEGSQDIILATAGEDGEKLEEITIEDVVEGFKEFKGIPKIFFIQACRSQPENPHGPVGDIVKQTTIDLGVEINLVDDLEDEYQGVSGDERQSRSESESVTYSPPCLDDSVILFSTPVGYSAGFSTQYGSHIWEKLYDVMKQRGNTTDNTIDFLSLLRELNRSLSFDEDQELKKIKYKPLASICHRLTKRLVFNTVK